jgi:dinuclear metal center YbgI/SA1388 family protein
MKILYLISVIERFAAPELQEDYDNCGLITGLSSWDCSGVVCTLDVTTEVVHEAIQQKCNLIIAHHPIIFRGLKKINGKNYVEQVVLAAIKNDIAIYAAHTNMDNVISGVNRQMANKLGLVNTTILQPKKKVLRRLITFAPHEHAARVRKAVFVAGAGHIGKYSECSFNSSGKGTFKAEEGADPFVGEIGRQHQEDETKIEIVYPFYLENQVVDALVKNHPYEEVAYDIFTMENVHFGIGSGIIGELEKPLDENQFLELIHDRFNAGGIRHTGLLGRPVKRVAVCGGAGSFLTPKALAAGADWFLTADVKYHEFFDAEGRMVLADIGHYESEQFTAGLFHSLLLEKFPNFAVLKSKVNTNPVRYYHKGQGV